MASARRICYDFKLETSAPSNSNSAHPLVDWDAMARIASQNPVCRTKDMEHNPLEARVSQLEERHTRLLTTFCSLVLIQCILFGVWGVNQALAISKFQDIYLNFLFGKVVPFESTFVVRIKLILILLAIALPLFALALFIWMKDRLRCIGLQLAILVLIVLQLILTRYALWEPIHTIIIEMSG